MKKSNFRLSAFDWILFGILLYELGFLFKINSIYSFIFKILGLIVIFFNVVFRLSYVLPFFGFKRVLFFLYLFWNLFVFLYSLLTTGFSGFSPFNQYGWLSLITPLIVFLGIQNLSLKSVFKVSYIYGIIGIVITILNFKDIFRSNISISDEEYANYSGIASMSYVFLFSTSLMILCYSFVEYKYRRIAFFAILINLIIVLFAARRGGIFMNLLFLIFTFYLYIISSKKGLMLPKILFVLAFVAVGIGLFVMYSDTAFSLLYTRLDSDSRSPVETAFYDSFRGETLDWIFGRGINGSYYCILFDDSFVNYRGIIETGYLYIILKGGLISLSFFLFFLLNSAYVGFFKTNNNLTKAMALYLVAHVIYLFPFGLPSFSFEYIIVWICVAYCQSKVWRMKSDRDIKVYLRQNPIINIKAK